MCKIIMTFSLLMCCFATSVQAFEHNLIQNQQLHKEDIEIQKIYIQPSEIYFSDNKIFVQTIKGLVEIPSIQSDSMGVYYQTEHPYSWYCKCGEYNANRHFCERCGKATPED